MGIALRRRRRCAHGRKRRRIHTDVAVRRPGPGRARGPSPGRLRAQLPLRRLRPRTPHLVAPVGLPRLRRGLRRGRDPSRRSLAPDAQPPRPARITRGGDGECDPCVARPPSHRRLRNAGARGARCSGGEPRPGRLLQQTRSSSPPSPRIPIGSWSSSRPGAIELSAHGSSSPYLDIARTSWRAPAASGVCSRWHLRPITRQAPACSTSTTRRSAATCRSTSSALRAARFTPPPGDRC